MVLEQLNIFLERLDTCTEPLDFLDISEQLTQFAKNYEGINPPSEFLAESLAFDLYENNLNWGLYYGPQFGWTDETGTIHQYPELESITPNVISYWEKRAYQCKHLNLIIRYSDLVWEFSKIVTQKQASIELAHYVIDNTILCAELDFYISAVRFKNSLQRALSISIQINDLVRINKLVDTIIKYEEKVAEDDKPGLWGFSFDWLIDNKKVNLSDKDADKIINDLEERLDRISSVDYEYRLSAVELITARLAKYYRKVNRKDDLYRVLNKFRSVCFQVSEIANPMESYHWLHKVYTVFKDYGLNEDAEEILAQIHLIGTKFELKKFEHRVKLPVDLINQYIEKITANSPEEALKRITIEFMQDVNKLKMQVNDLYKEYPLAFLVNKKLIDHKGRVIATIGPLEEDEMGNVINQMSNSMRLQAIFLRKALEKTFERYELDETKILEYLARSPAFDDSKKELLLMGLRSYINKDNITAIHILVPLIEDAFRRVLQLCGGVVLKENRNGDGFQYKVLDEILRDEKLIKLFGENLMLYFRIVLTDRRGWNVRNEVAHGLLPKFGFSFEISDRLIHILLCLEGVRLNA